MGRACEASADFVQSWQESGGEAGSEGQFEAFAAHLSGCRQCGLLYGHLLPLMERDFGQGGGAPADEAFVSRVMDALPALPSTTTRSRRLPWPMAAAAAIAVLVVGAFALSRFLPPAGGDTVAVHFTLDAPEASSVTLVGSFSDWSADDRFRLTRAAGGTWELSVRLKKHELYSYGFLIDGEKWLADPRATESVDDGFGGSNSVLRL
jgi:hypothetical protein